MATSAPTSRALTASLPGVDPRGGRQRDAGRQLRPQDGDPAQRQTAGPRSWHSSIAVDHVERLEIEVRLVEAVEEHEPVGAGRDDLVRAKSAIAV